MSKLVLQGDALTTQMVQMMADALDASIITSEHYVTLASDQPIADDKVQTWRQQFPVDINWLPDMFDVSQVKLLVTDMDSTLISIECVDEIADFIGAKAKVAAITEQAMRGEIDFETSLRQRVSLLKGLDVAVLEQVYQQRLRLNPGAEQLITGLKKAAIKTALVSGGFTFFTERLKERLDLDFTLANVLQERDGKLTGDVEGDICGAQAKADFLLKQSEQLAIERKQTVAMGDGANDLLMMAESGLSVAYHAKPKVQKQASAVLNYCGLDGVLGLLQL